MLKPRQQRHQIKRRNILNTALELVLEKGLNQFSLRELARRVNYSPAGLYEFFQNKDDIINELHANGFSALTRTLNNSKKTNDCKSNLRNIGVAYLKFARDNDELYRLIFSHIPSSKKTLQALIAGSESFNIVSSAMQAFMDSRDYAKKAGHTVEALSFSYWAILHGISILPLTTTKNFDNDFQTIQENAIEIFIRGLTIKGDAPL